MNEDCYEVGSERTGGNDGEAGNGVSRVLGTSRLDGDRVMLREGFKHGFSEGQWIAAKEEARQAVIAVARSKSVIAYSDLVRKITSCILEPNGAHLAHMLGEISSEEDEEGRGLLTVVVVHKTGDLKPGPGFFRLARSRGRHIVDEEEFWIEELHNVYDAWST